MLKHWHQGLQIGLPNAMVLMKPCQTFYKESTQERARNQNKGQGPKSRQANSPTKAGHKEERNSMVSFFLPWGQYKAIEFSIY
jgi:hypothetical protein